LVLFSDIVPLPPAKRIDPEVILVIDGAFRNVFVQANV